MKKIILSAMLLSSLITTTGLYSIVEPEKPLQLEQLTPQLKNLGIKIDDIKAKVTQQRLILPGLNRKKTIGIITLYKGLQKGLAKLKEKISWSEGQLRTWGWVLVPRLKSQLQKTIDQAKVLKPKLKRQFNKLKAQFPSLEGLKLQGGGTT